MDQTTGQTQYLEDLYRFFENYQDAVLVMDTETLKICYLNRAALRHFHLAPDADYRKLHCYEVFEEKLSRCSNCIHMSHLPEPGQFYIWNSKLHEHKSAYRLKDTQIVADGRSYLLEIIQKLDYDMELGRTLRSMTENEQLINEAMEAAMNEADPEKAIDLAIGKIGESLHCDRTYIFEENEQGSFDNTYEWCAPGVTRQKENLQDCPCSVLQVWYDEFDKHRNVIITDLEDYRSVSEAMYRYLKPQDIHTLVVAPLMLDNRRIGFFGVDNPPADAIMNISTMFEVLGHFLSAMIRHRDNEDKLEKMSDYDQMTGLRNRHELNKFLKTIDPTKSIAYLFCDLNGLKRVNDTKGHDAGDTLIVDTARILRRVFHKTRVFRMGGDEFLIILPGVSKDLAAEKAGEIREAFNAVSIHAAIGVLWREKATESFDTLYAEVDRLMYLDKRAWYGERRRNRRRQEK